MPWEVEKLLVVKPRTLCYSALGKQQLYHLLEAFYFLMIARLSVLTLTQERSSYLEMLQANCCQASNFLSYRCEIRLIDLQQIGLPPGDVRALRTASGPQSVSAQSPVKAHVNNQILILNVARPIASSASPG